ncbi:MAG TPA: ABC transporter permease [Terracidiphilus sp.]|nr:ABC transporter permease [Terracidiphilus sp.]
MSSWTHDLRFSVRLLRRKPGYTAVVIVTLALGIGAVTSVVSLVNTVLIRSYGPINPDRWVYIWEHRTSSQSLNQISASIPNFRDWRAGAANVFADIVVWLPWSYTASGSGIDDPERVRAAVVSPEIFASLHSRPMLGRFLTEEDSKSGERRVMLSYDFWRRACGADPQIVGRTIQLNAATHTVIGIASPGFAFPPEEQVDVWTIMPASVLASANRASRGYRVAAMLQPGVTPEMAQSVMNGVTRHLAEQYPEDRDYGALVIPMREGVAGDFRAPLVALSGAVGFALLLLCLNIGFLRSVHLEARRKELVLRVALGARKLLICRQLLIETSLLFAVGSGLGILLAPALVRLLVSFVPAQEIPWLHAEVDGRVFAIAVLLTTFAAVVGAVLPAVRAIRSGSALNLSLPGALTTTAGNAGRLRAAMITTQIALAFVPLCAAALLMQSFVRLQGVDAGFNTSHRLSFELFAPKGRYAGPEQISSLAGEILLRTRSIPGLGPAALAQAIPFSPGPRWLQAISRGDPKGVPNIATLPLVRYSVVTPGYFEAMGIPLKAGRLIANSDSRDAQPVVLINQKLAKMYFPGEDPVGEQLWIGHAESLPGSAPRIVAGVVGDTHMYALDSDPDAAAWVPLAQQTSSEDIWRNLFFVAQCDSGPSTVVPAIRELLKSIDPGLAISDVSSMAQRVDDSLWQQRISSTVLAAFSLATLAIAVLGIFGVTGFLVAQRSREIGIRIAIGAQPGDIRRMILGQNLVLSSIGVVFGLAGALALTRLLQSLLFDVRPQDPLTLAAVALVMVVAGASGSLIPARRAAKVDPVVALRSE